MPRFEYHFLRFLQADLVSDGGSSVVSVLDGMGGEGWELVALLPEQGRADSYVAILKKAL